MRTAKNEWGCGRVAYCTRLLPGLCGFDSHRPHHNLCLDSSMVEHAADNRET